MTEAHNSNNTMDENERSPKNVFQRFKATKTWTVIEIVLPILAIVIPTALYFYSVKSGEITISGVQRTSLINTRNEVGQDVTVLYRNVRIASLVSYTLEIANTGNTDIGKEDIYKLKWFPPTDSQILDARITSKTGDYGDFISLDVPDSRTLGVNVLALNKGVSARINILCSSNSPHVDDSTSRIDGVIRGASIIDNSRNFNTLQQNSFIENVFAGGVWTNLAKAVIFFLLTFVILLIVIILFARIDTWRSNKGRAKEQAADRELVHNLASGVLDPEKMEDSNRVKWLAETVKFFKALNQEQFDLCRRVVEKTPENKLAGIVLGKPLTEMERDSVRQTPNIGVFFNSILQYRSLYKPEEVINVFIRSGRFADNPVN